MTLNDDEARRRRKAMVAEIAEEVAATAHWLGKGKLDPRVVAALERIPRHRFMPPVCEANAYENRPQPIGHGQTISQPYIVAIMSDLAQVSPGDRVLEIGTGRGYQTAVLAELGAEVYSIEVVEELYRPAVGTLAELGYGNLHLRLGDGSLGWPEAAPFKAILVTAAAHRRVPPPLLEQLAPGGRLVVPLQVGAGLPGRGEQQLLLIEKDDSGKVNERAVLPVAFVPLIEPAPPRRTA